MPGPKRLLALAMAAPLLLAACSGFYPPDQPDRIVNRLPLASCGAEAIDPSGTSVNVEARVSTP